MPQITLEDFARSFGISVGEFSAECRELIANGDFRYSLIEGWERDQVILSILKKMESDKQKIGAPERTEVWDKGWGENLSEFIANKYDLKKLTPKFIRPNQIVRFNQDLIKPSNPMFELDYYKIFRLWLYQTYFKAVGSVYEFGCGTGFNLVELAQLYPKKKLFGSDFVSSSKDLVNKIGEAYHWNISGHLFDMIHPDEGFNIEENSAVFTIGSLEQLASKFEAFLQFLLARSPKICVNVEPTVELYDEDNLVDYLAIKFHRKRGYTEGFLPRLKELEAEGKIEILKVKRLFWGSLYMEGYTCMVWKPKHSA